MILGIPIPDPMQTAERGQAMALKDLPTAVIMALVLAVVGLFAWLMLVYGKLNKAQDQRVADKDADRTRSDALAREVLAFMRETSQTVFVLGEKTAETGRKVDELRESLQGKKRAPPAVPVTREAK